MKSKFDAEQVVTRFKIDLLKKMPFYGDVLSHLPFQADTSIPTACTNGYSIRYNPRFLQSLENPGEVNFVLMHEIMHVLLLHAHRAGGRNHQIWNIAGDLVINHMLAASVSKDMQKAGIPFQMPSSALFSNLRCTDTTESVYEEQLALNPSAEGSPGQKVQTLSRVTLLIRPDRRGLRTVKISAVPPSDLLPAVPSAGNEKKGSSSKKRAGKGKVVFSPEETAGEGQILQIIRDALQKTRGTGGSYFIPGEVQLYQVPAKKPLNWKRLLKDFLSAAISEDTSYDTPERKYLHMDLIVPGHGHSDGELEEVWAFVDSSGSISASELNAFLTQLYRLMKEFPCRLHLCYWDTMVTDVYINIRREKDIFKHPPRHSGGTDINCIYQWMKENHVRPDVMIILTDGWFGSLRQEYCRPSLKRKTILVLNDSKMAERSEIKQIGRVASL